MKRNTRGITKVSHTKEDWKKERQNKEKKYFILENKRIK